MVPVGIGVEEGCKMVFTVVATGTGVEVDLEGEVGAGVEVNLGVGVGRASSHISDERATLDPHSFSAST